MNRFLTSIVAWLRAGYPDGVPQNDYIPLLALLSRRLTNDEVKAAYRKMALKHHPDRVATLGEDIRKAAEKKFQEINDAKERIYKARGL